MKKSILLMLPFALGLAACSGGSPLDKGNIITPKFMERNFRKADQPELVGTEYEVEKVIEIGDYSFGGYIDSSYKNAVVFEDADGKVGIFSQSLGKFVTPFVELEEAYVDVVDVGTGVNVGFVEYSTFDDESEETWTWTVVDELGNQPFTPVSIEAGSYMEVGGRLLSATEKTGQEFFIAFMESYGGGYSFEPQFAVYNLDGSISRKGAYSEYVEKEGEPASIGYTDTMEAYGHPELARVQTTTTNGTRYSFYNTNEKKFVSSFEILKSAKKFTAGDFYVFQEVNEVEERATEYNYYAGGKKYNVTTTKINYTNGNKETLDSKVLFVNAVNPVEVVDEKGVVKYAYYENVQVIRDDRTLENQKYGFMLDEGLNVAADITGIKWASLERIDNDHYFDATTDIMYDGKLNEVAYLPQANSVDKNGAIFTSREGVYGMYSLDGKVILPAKYAGIVATGYENIYLAAGEKDLSFVKVENGAASVIKSFSYEQYEAAGWYDPFRTKFVFSDISLETPENVFFNVADGQEFTPFEPAEGETVLGNMGANIYVLGGLTRVYQTLLVQKADGSLYGVRYMSSMTAEFPTFAE